MCLNRIRQWLGGQPDPEQILRKKQTMESIGVATFIEQCRSLLDHLPPDGLVITKDGQIVAMLLPVSSQSDSLIGSMKGKIQVKGDILST